MKRAFFFIFIILVCVFELDAQKSKCSVEDCINNTFNNIHLNKWQISNKIDNQSVGDSFILIEGKSGDTSMNDVNGYLTVVNTTQISLIVEHDEKIIYILPHRSQGESLAIKNNLSDSIFDVFKDNQVDEMDSIAKNTFSLIDNGTRFTVKINPNSCLLEWLEYTLLESEETEDQSGFYKEEIVKRTIHYELISNESNRYVVKQAVNINKYIIGKNNRISLHPNYSNFELNDLSLEIE